LQNIGIKASRVCARALSAWNGRLTFDPLTGRVTEYYANAAYCRLAGGASVEEHLAAVAARALPEHVTQLDHLLRLTRW
jgi:hypothetical protein